MMACDGKTRLRLEKGEKRKGDNFIGQYFNEYDLSSDSWPGLR